MSTKSKICPWEHFDSCLFTLRDLMAATLDFSMMLSKEKDVSTAYLSPQYPRYVLKIDSVCGASSGEKDSS